MPMRDSWPCASASGSSRSMNCAGSCDSMISINSAYSDDSMEHLSAEERACLMFLEETIESLEAGEDSGVSNNESDRPSHNMINKMAQLGSISHTKPQALSVHDDPNKVLGKDHKPHILLVPTPLVLANGNAKLLKKSDSSANELKPNKTLLVSAPKNTAINSHQSLGTLTSSDGSAISAPNPGGHKPNAYSPSGLTDLPPSFIPEPPVTRDTSSVAKDNLPKSNLCPRSDQKLKSVSSNIPMELLPPPSDFMDEPVFLPPVVPTLPSGQCQPPTSTLLSSQAVSQVPSQPCQSESMAIAPPPGFEGHAEADTPLTALSTSPRVQLSPNELDKLRKKASMKKAPERVPLILEKPAHHVADQENSPTFGPDPSVVTVVESGEPKSPPIVAPKPKKLPSSIILKSHKDATPGHSLVSPGDRMVMNQQKVHLEALKKLGLLKSDEPDSGLFSGPPHKAPQQTSFNTSTSASSPSPEPTTDAVFMHVDHHAAAEAQGKPDSSLLHAHPENGDREHLLITRAASPKLFEMKTASMERSGVGQKSLTLENPSQLSSHEESPGNTVLPLVHLRNSRSRPASEGNWKDFSIDHITSDSNREPELRRSLPISALPQPKVEPQKSLRSHGISVVISPQSKNGEDRKQALRRLGLIKD